MGQNCQPVVVIIQKLHTLYTGGPPCMVGIKLRASFVLYVETLLTHPYSICWHIRLSQVLRLQRILGHTWPPWNLYWYYSVIIYTATCTAWIWATIVFCISALNTVCEVWTSALPTSLCSLDAHFLACCSHMHEWTARKREQDEYVLTTNEKHRCAKPSAQLM